MINQIIRVRTGCFSCDALKNVVDKRVEDGHGLVGDTSIRVHLSQDCDQGQRWNCKER
jgi:hypothetical protein